MTRVLTRWLVCVAALGMASASVDAQNRVRAPHVGQPAPEFSLQNIGGETISLADFKGRKNVLMVVDRGWIGYW